MSAWIVIVGIVGFIKIGSLICQWQLRHRKCPACAFTPMKYSSYPSDFMMEHEEWHCPRCNFLNVECVCQQGFDHWSGGYKE